MVGGEPEKKPRGKAFLRAVILFAELASVTTFRKQLSPGYLFFRETQS